MLCLQCWGEISEKHAFYTKSCSHVFSVFSVRDYHRFKPSFGFEGQNCSDEAFKKELSCPLCDTVLPKDGVGTMTLRPDSMDLKKVSSKVFGFEPHEMCEVLQAGLEFWARQRQNEALKRAQDLRIWKKRVEESEEHVRKLSTALDEERMKKQSIIEEKEYLERLVSELETRYAEKARSMRKLSELYNELRQVHKRLEIDLRGVRESDDRNPDVLDRSEIEVRTIKAPGKPKVERESVIPRPKRTSALETLSEKKSYVDRDAVAIIAEPRTRARSKPPVRSRQDSSEPRAALFQLAPYPARSSLGGSLQEQGVVLEQRRDRQHRCDRGEEYEAQHRLTRRPSGHDGQ